MPKSDSSLHIFVADGLRIVERSNWVGRAPVFLRAAWAQHSLATRPELQQTGVCLLLGPRDDGEGDPIMPRLANRPKCLWRRATKFFNE